MPLGAGILIAAVFLIVDSIIVWTVINATTSSFRTLAEKYPATEVSEPYVRREFSSIRIGYSNFDHCFHIAIDRDYLHVHPAALMRLCGLKSMSVERSEIVVPETESRGFLMKGSEVRVGKSRLWLPAWCIEELRKPADDQASSIDEASS